MVVIFSLIHISLSRFLKRGGVEKLGNIYFDIYPLVYHLFTLVMHETLFSHIIIAYSFIEEHIS